MMHFDTLRIELINSLHTLEKLSFTVGWTKQAFENDLQNPNANYVLLVDDETVIAYGAFWQAADSADITNIAVHPEHRRKGFGKQVLEKLLKDAQRRGIAQLFLEVRVSNVAAQALYTACGFKRVGERKKYYADNQEDAVIMAKNLEIKG